MTATASAASSSSRFSVITGALCAGRAILERFPTSILALAFRVGVAMVFWKSGLTKISSWDSTVALFDMEYMVPVLPAAVAAFLATVTELGCSALLVLGLGTRFAAAALLGMTFVIQVFVYPEHWTDHLLWASILAYLVTRGAGTLSLDHLIGRRLLPGRG